MLRRIGRYGVENGEAKSESNESERGNGK